MSYIRKDAIDKVYKDLGGTDPMQRSATVSDLIEKIGDVVKVRDGELSEKLLPEVTATNNGNVLKVVNGRWAVGAASGGSIQPVIAKATSRNMGFVLDKTYNDLFGKLAYVKFETRNENTIDDYYPVASFYENVSGGEYGIRIDAGGDIVFGAADKTTNLRTRGSESAID